MPKTNYLIEIQLKWALGNSLSLYITTKTKVVRDVCVKKTPLRIISIYCKAKPQLQEDDT